MRPGIERWEMSLGFVWTVEYVVLTVAGVIACHVMMWRRTLGRSPGTAAALGEDTTESMSAAAARYLLQSDVDDGTFVAAMLEMITKGVVAIRSDLGTGRLAIVRGSAPAWAVGLAERDAVRALFSSGERVELSATSASRLRAARAQLAAGLHRTLGTLFVSHRAATFPGIFLSVIMCAPIYHRIGDVLPSNDAGAYGIVAAVSLALAMFAASSCYACALALRRHDLRVGAPMGVLGIGLTIGAQLLLGGGPFGDLVDFSWDAPLAAGLVVPLVVVNVVAAKILSRVPNREGERLQALVVRWRRRLLQEQASGTVSHDAVPFAYALNVTPQAGAALQEALTKGSR